MTIVLDTSAAIEFILNTDKAETVGAYLFEEAQPIYSPELIDVEVCQVLRRYYLNENLAADTCSQALTNFLEMPIQRFSHADLVPMIWQYRNNLTAYDAAFTALASLLDAPLLTCDKKLANSPTLDATCIVV